MTQLETHAASFATMKSSSLNWTSSPEGCTRVIAWCGAGPHAAIVPLFTVRCVAASSARNAVSSAVSRSPKIICSVRTASTRKERSVPGLAPVVATASFPLINLPKFYLSFTILVSLILVKYPDRVGLVNTVP